MEFIETLLTPAKQTVKFDTQVIRNQQILQKLKNQHVVIPFQSTYRCAEILVSEKMLRNELQNYNKKLPFKFATNHYKHNENDYLQLQTRTIHHLGVGLKKHNQLPKSFILDQYDLDKIDIIKPDVKERNTYLAWEFIYNENETALLKQGLEKMTLDLKDSTSAKKLITSKDGQLFH